MRPILPTASLVVVLIEPKVATSDTGWGTLYLAARAEAPLNRLDLTT